MARMPAVAGMFYEGDAEGLRERIEACFEGKLGPGRRAESGERRAEGRDQRAESGGQRAESGGQRAEKRVIGLVSPHAGFVYSGSAAAWAYDALAESGIPDVAVILGPNHHGLGAPVAVGVDEWTTPLGTVQVDMDVARAILDRSEYAREENTAHLREHSIEVQLPFLQYIGGDRTRIVPIALAHLAERDMGLVVADLGSAIAGALRELGSGNWEVGSGEGKRAVVIASTDFTHYESRASAQAKDALALEKIVNLDAKGLIRVVEDNSITMCGVTGTATMIEACKQLGAKSARTLTYYTSGDVTGDTRQVVGYAAVGIWDM